MVNLPKSSPYEKFSVVPDNEAWKGTEQPGEPIGIDFPDGVELFATGIRIPEATIEEDWNEIGRKLATIEKSSQWALGDWWSFGDHKYGERTEAAKKLKLDPDYLSTLGWVCRKIPTSSRKEVLSFKHHEAVAKFDDPEVQKKWLSKAFRGSAVGGMPAKPWSVSKLREAIHTAEQTYRAFDDREFEQKDPDGYRRAQSAETAKNAIDRFEKVTKGDWFLSSSIRAITTEQPFISDLPDHTVMKLIDLANGIAEMFSEVVSVLKRHQEGQSNARDFDANEPAEKVEARPEKITKKPVKRERMRLKVSEKV
jgi:hypothetical protein